MHMRFVTSISVVIAGVVLAGCGTHAVRNPFSRSSLTPLLCTQQNCPHLAVDLTQACPPPAELSDYKLTGARNSRQLVWEINGPYQFSRANYKYGIYVLGDTIGDRVQSVSITESGKQLVMRFDRQADDKAFSYKLNLRHEITKAWCEIDPWIVDAL